MATEVETLLVQLRADAKSYEKAMAQAVASTDANTRRIERQFEKTNKSVAAAMQEMRGHVSKGVGGFDTSKLLGGLAAGAITKEITNLADRWQEATNKIKALGLGDLEAKGAMDAIAGIADRSRTDFAATADLYARLSRAGQGFGATQAQVAVATEVVAKSLKVTGASAQETESTLIQLGQALTSGRLQGDELRSLSENAPVVAKAIADAFGVSVGQLKDLGAEGKLTSDRVFKAIVDAQPAVEKAFAATSGTVADGWKRIETAAIKFVGTSSTTNGALAAMSAALNGVATNFDTLATGAAALGAILVSRLAAAGLAPVIAAFGATVASGTAAGATIGAAGAAAAGSATGFAAAALGTRALGAGLMTIVGGPVGVVLLGLITVLGFFAGKAAEGSQASKVYATALAEVEAQSGRTAPAVKAVGTAVEETSRKMAEGKTDVLIQNFQQLIGDAQNVERAIGAATAKIENFGGVKVSSAEREAALAAIKAGLEGDAAAADAARAKLEELGGVNPSFAAAFSKITALLGALAGLRQSAVVTQAALGGVGVAQADADRRALEAKFPNPTAGTTYDQDVAATRKDPVVRELIGQGIARRARIDAEMDKTAKKYRDGENELRDKIHKEGGIAPDNIQSMARAIVDAEEAGGGGGKKGGGEAEENKLDKITQAHQRRVEALAREKDALGQTTFEVARAEEAHRLLDAVKDAEIPITEALRAKIDQLSSAYAATKVRLDEARSAQQSFRELQQFIGQSLSSFFSDVVSGGKNASEALMNLGKRLADAAFQAALLGSGPLAGILGSKGENGAVGGLIGMLFKGFSGIGGTGAGSGAGLPQLAVGTSNVPRDMAALIHQGEIVMPKYDADLLRSGKMGGAERGPVSVVIDVRGATGNAEIQRMVAAGVSQGMAAVEQKIGRNAHTMFHDAQARFG